MSGPNNSGESTILPTAEPTLITFNPAAQFPLKLMVSNFSYWRAQVFALMMGLDLMGFLDGSTVAPAEKILLNGVSSINPAHTQWFRQDKLLLHAIFASVSESVFPYICSAVTSRAVWIILQKLFASRSRSQTMNLKDRLSQEKKGTRSITTYLQAIRHIAAELLLVQAPVADDDLVIHILRGLGPEYREFAAAIRARDSSIDIDDLHDKLVEFESDLQSHKSTPDVSPVTAYSTQRSGYRGGPNQSQRRRGLLPTPATSPPNPPLSSMNDGQRRPRSSIVCQYCEKIGHSTRQCFQLRQRPAQAHHTTTVAPVESSWLLDSAATNHVTSELGDLSLYSDYQGPDEILVGDGSGTKHGGTSSSRPE